MVLYIDDHDEECNNVPEQSNNEVDYFWEVAAVRDKEKFYWPTTWSWTGGELISFTDVLAKAW